MKAIWLVQHMVDGENGPVMAAMDEATAVRFAADYARQHMGDTRTPADLGPYTDQAVVAPIWEDDADDGHTVTVIRVDVL